MESPRLVTAIAMIALISTWMACAEKSIDSVGGALHQETRNFRDQEFHVIHFSPEEVDLRLYWKNPDEEPFGNFLQLNRYLESKGETLAFAANAGIFSEDLSPGGLHIENGKALSPLNLKNGEGNFHMMPNGVFLVGENGAKVIESGEFETLKDSVYLGSQSGPLLVCDDKLHEAFQEGSDNKYVRSGVGVSPTGEVFFAISKRRVNFYDFGMLFRSQLNCPNALYLDGAISRFYCPQAGLTEMGGDFVGIFGVIGKL